MLSLHSRSQETKWFSVCHLLVSQPASLMTVIAVITSMLSILVRSVPVMRNNAFASQLRLIALFFLEASLALLSGRGAPALAVPLLEIVVQLPIALAIGFWQN